MRQLEKNILLTLLDQPGKTLQNLDYLRRYSLRHMASGPPEQYRRSFAPSKAC